MNDPVLHRTACQIATYWLGRPQACDTAGGVHRWWLHTQVHPLHVRQALDMLVHDGIARPGRPAPASAGADGPTFHLAASTSQLQAWLAAHCGSAVPSGVAPPAPSVPPAPPAPPAAR